MLKKQYVEGLLEGCKRASCPRSCCDNEEVEEWIIEYFAFHERLKDYLISQGIQIEFIGDRVRFKNCSDGKRCKFLKHSLNKDIDPRPIDCKIYPFVVDWDSIDFDKKIVNLYYPSDESCPLIRKGFLPETFKKEIENIIKRDFAVLFHGAIFTVNSSNEPYKGASKY